MWSRVLVRVGSEELSRSTLDQEGTNFPPDVRPGKERRQVHSFIHVHTLLYS